MTETLSNSAGHLCSLIERIEKLEDEKAAISGDIKEVYAEAKATGFDTKIMRLLVRLRKKTAEERLEEETLLEVYMNAMGMGHASEEAAA